MALIRELAGKDLAITVILRFLLYVTPTLIPLIFPLTILLFLLWFLEVSEHYEFAAMKSTGIPLQRAMKHHCFCSSFGLFNITLFQLRSSMGKL